MVAWVVQCMEGPPFINTSQQRLSDRKQDPSPLLVLLFNHLNTKMEDWENAVNCFNSIKGDIGRNIYTRAPPLCAIRHSIFWGLWSLLVLEVASSELFSTNQCRSRKVKSDVRAWPRISTQAAKVRVSGNNHMLQTMFPHARGL